MELPIVDNPSDEDIWKAAVIISLGRIYDVLITILGQSDLEKANDLIEMHRHGKMWFPPPAYLGEE